MAATQKHLPLSSSSSNKSLNLSDLLGKLYTITENLKHTHKNDIDILNQKLQDLENENKRLRIVHQQHPHSIFDIDYVSNDSATIDQLQSDLKQAQKQVDALQTSLNEQFSECEDMKAKYNLQRLMNENHREQQTSTVDSNKITELELKLKQIKDQVNQFDQCNYESEEQIRLLKQILSNNEQEQPRTITQSLAVKQSDLSQQTDFVENLLNKQQDKILTKIIELLDQNPRTDQATATKNRKNKRKRL